MPGFDSAVLFLGPDDNPLLAWLRKQESSVIQTEASIDVDFIKSHNAGFVFSFRYRHILGPEILAQLPDRVINLHLSLLPWNRGADPNLWSFVDDTPKGVTIHYADDGIDTGDIIAQRELNFSDDPDETLATTYSQLLAAAYTLFVDNWNGIKKDQCNHRKQTGPSSYHRSSDRQALSDRLVHGWDTPVAELAGTGQDHPLLDEGPR